MRLLHALLLLLPPLILAEITFSIEEPPLHPKGKHRRHHKHRHERDHPTVPVQEKPLPDRFTFECPHINDAANMEVKIEATWTRDDTVLLKIKDGNVVHQSESSTYRRKTISGKSVVHVEQADKRYLFNYDELTGDFMMEINEVNPLEDFGVWECHIIRRHGSETFAESTRKAIVAPPGGEEYRAKQEQRNHATTAGYRVPPVIAAGAASSGSESRRAYPRARIDYGSGGQPKEEYQTRTTQKFSAFTRPDANSVQISRDTVDRRKQTVVFDRSVTKGQHEIDYEFDAKVEEDNENDDFHYEHTYSKQARAAAIGSNSVSPSLGTLMVLLVTTVVALMTL